MMDGRAAFPPVTRRVAPARLLAASSGLLFLALAVAAMALPGSTRLSEFGEEGEVAPDVIAAEVRANEWVLGLQGLLLGAAGIAFLGLVHAMHHATRALPLWGMLAGVAAGTMWIAAGGVTHATVDLAGHFDHPDGVKTAIVVATALLSSPAAFLSMAAFVAAAGLAVLRSGALPRWFGRLSIVFAVLAGLGAVSFATYVSGAMVLIVLLPVWVLVASMVLLRGLWRGERAPAAAPG